jgi:hypothetical protein
MNTKAYAKCEVPYVSDDMGGREIARAIYTGADVASTGVPMQMQQRIEALIGATKQDLTKSLQYHTLVHKINAGEINVVKVDATGNSTACMSYEDTVQEESDDDQERDLISM